MTDGMPRGRYQALVGNGPQVIALTVHALAEDREKCLEAGMDEYLGAAIMLQDLNKILEDCRPPQH